MSWKVDSDIDLLDHFVECEKKPLTAYDVKEKLDLNTTNQARLRMEYLIKRNPEKFEMVTVKVRGAYGGEHNSQAIRTRNVDHEFGDYSGNNARIQDSTK